MVYRAVIYANDAYIVFYDSECNKKHSGTGFFFCIPFIKVIPHFIVFFYYLFSFISLVLFLIFSL